MTFFQLINLVGQNVHKISKGGISQIGNEFSTNSQYFVYTNVEFNKKKKVFEYGFNMIETANTTKINLHRDNFRFVAFGKDSIILGVNSENKLFSYNTVKNKIAKEYNFVLDDEIYSKCNFKFRNDTLFYKKGDNIQAYILPYDKNIVLIHLKDFGIDYKDIVSFDIKKDLVAVCLKKEGDSFDSIKSYHFFTYNLTTKQQTLIFKGPNTDENTFDPVLRLYGDQEIIYSYYLNHEMILCLYNFNKLHEVRKQTLKEYKLLNLSIANNGKIYLSLFNEQERERFAAQNVKRLGLGVLLSGCGVYSID